MDNEWASSNIFKIIRKQTGWRIKDPACSLFYPLPLSFCWWKSLSSAGGWLWSLFLDWSPWWKVLQPRRSMTLYSLNWGRPSFWTVSMTWMNPASANCPLYDSQEYSKLSSSISGSCYSVASCSPPDCSIFLCQFPNAFWDGEDSSSDSKVQCASLASSHCKFCSLARSTVPSLSKPPSIWCTIDFS